MGATLAKVSGVLEKGVCHVDAAVGGEDGGVLWAEVECGYLMGRGDCW